MIGVATEGERLAGMGAYVGEQASRRGVPIVYMQHELGDRLVREYSDDRRELLRPGEDPLSRSLVDAAGTSDLNAV